MTKQKQVFDRAPLSHQWAHGLQDSGRDKGGNMFFSGPLLYSYGHHFIIAARVVQPDGEVGYLVNGSTYSPTTTTHQGFARSAMPSYSPKVYVPRLNDSLWRDPAALVRDCVEASRKARDAAAVTRAGTSKRAGLEGDARHWAAQASALLNILPAHTSDRERVAACRKAMRAEFRKLAPVPGIAMSAEPATLAAQWDAIAREVCKGKLADAVQAHHNGVTRLQATANALATAFDVNEYALGQHHAARALVASSVREVDALAKRAGVRSPLTKAARKACADALAAMDAAISKGATERAAASIANARAQWAKVTPENFDGVDVEKLRHLCETVTAAAKLLPDAEAAEARGFAFTLSTALDQRREQNRRKYAANKVDEARAMLANASEANLRGNYANALTNAARAKSALEQARAQWADVPISFELPSELVLADWARLEDERNAATVAQWREGNGPRTLYGLTPRPLLRIVDDTIETSHGASVPVSVAPMLWALICKARRSGCDLVAGGSFPRGSKAGDFELRTVRADGSAVIGCHDIAGDEFDRIADALGFAPLAACVPTERAAAQHLTAMRP